MKYLIKMPFQSAFTYILDNRKHADLPTNHDVLKVKQYLSKSRYIHNTVVDCLLDNKLLFQEKHTDNAIFPMYDGNNIIVGAEIQGTILAKRFNGIKSGSKRGYGFNVRFSSDNTFKYALFFESAVDLMSFIDYKAHHDGNSLNRCILISMAGLDINVLRNTPKAFKSNLIAVLCVDNDAAGRAFKNIVTQEKIPFIDRSPDERFKDWNEQNSAWRGSVPIMRALKREKEKASKFSLLIR